MNAPVISQRLETSSELVADGFAIVAAIASPKACAELADELTELHRAEREKSSNKLGGLRNLIRTVPQVSRLASSTEFKAVLEGRLGRNFFPVRAIFFDKTPEANWSVPWHQDLTIAVKERIETEQFQAWSVKEGIIHVQPPRGILENMVTLRLHLDDCTSANGALKVIPGSHLNGRLNAEQIVALTSKKKPFVCEVKSGGVLLMRPFILHSSSAAVNASHRRVLHIEYASDELPNGLQWFDR